MKETFLDSLLRELRIKKIKNIVVKINNCRLLDVGCGWEARFLKQMEPFIASGVGIDFKVPDIKTDKIKTIKYTIKKEIPFKDNTFDIVTLLAVLEHLEKPLDAINEIHKVLKPNGLILITVPSKYAKPALEFLSYKLNIIDKNEILDHKQYFNKKDLYDFFNKINGLEILTHKYFQFRMNNFLVVRKL